MLEGLEATEVKFLELDSSKRIDAELYNKNYSVFITAIKKIPFTTFAEECKIIRKGIFDIKSSYYTTKGIPFVRISNLKDMIINTDDIVYIPKNEHVINNKTALKRNDIILSKTAIAAASIVDLPECNTSQDTIAIKLKDDSHLLSHYLVVFLNTKYGLEQMQRRFTGNIQMHLNLDECKKEVRIPVFPMIFQEKIKCFFEESIALSKQSKGLYAEAENLLLEELGLKDWQPTNESVSIKSFSDFQQSCRLDAEYYQLKYDEMLAKIQQKEYKALVEIVNIKKSIEPGSEAYQDSGVPFYRVANLSKFGLSDTDIYLNKSEYYTTRLQPKKNTILLSKDGSVGIAYKVEQDMEAITSGAILHLNIKDKDFLSDYVTLVLNSVVVKMQAERDAGGSIIQHWKPSEIEQVVIPHIPMPIQTQIAAKIQQSFALKAESKRLLDEAKAAVEREIETN